MPISITIYTMPIISLDGFISAKLDYLIIGGSTAGLVVATQCIYTPLFGIWDPITHVLLIALQKTLIAWWALLKLVSIMKKNQKSPSPVSCHILVFFQSQVYSPHQFFCRNDGSWNPQSKVQLVILLCATKLHKWSQDSPISQERSYKLWVGWCIFLVLLPLIYRVYRRLAGWAGNVPGDARLS